ncbi:hypothetical protein H0H93_008232 [Arthromyces matolae]|nr:hypothetical protein H0H93_008232 [Arthromyces matolae]
MTTITIDDRNPSITYEGHWVQSGTSNEYDGTTTGSVEGFANATATFTFIAVFGTIGAPAQSTYAIDGTILLKLTSPDDLSDIHYQQTFFTSPQLSPGQHTLVITSLLASAPLWIDYLEYTSVAVGSLKPPTASDPSTTTTSKSSSSPSSSSPPPSTQSTPSTASSPSTSSTTANSSLPQTSSSSSAVAGAGATSNTSPQPAGTSSGQLIGPSNTSVATTSSGPPSAAIIGGTVGGVILLLLLITSCLLYRRRRRNSAPLLPSLHTKSASQQAITPFMPGTTTDDFNTLSNADGSSSKTEKFVPKKMFVHEPMQQQHYFGYGPAPVPPNGAPSTTGDSSSDFYPSTRSVTATPSTGLRASTMEQAGLYSPLNVETPPAYTSVNP